LHKHLNIIVTGKVQGVSYRISTQTKAQQIGITGFVRNESNKSVYIEAEGEENLLADFIAWCKIGPPKAEVNELKITEGSLKKFASFIIERIGN
jgi:acylphosphatase